MAWCNTCLCLLCVMYKVCFTSAGLIVQLSGRSDDFKHINVSAPGSFKELRAAVQNALRPLLDGKVRSSTACYMEVQDVLQQNTLTDSVKFETAISNHVLQDFSLTNFTVEVKDDESVRALSDGEKLWAVILDPSNHVVPTKVCMSCTLSQLQAELAWPLIHQCYTGVFTDTRATLPQERVTFQPHPNTLTMAGELEYWAAQVRSKPASMKKSLYICSLLDTDLKSRGILVQGRSPLPYALSELIDNALRATRNNNANRRITITLATSGGTTPSAGLISVWDNGMSQLLDLFDHMCFPGTSSVS